MRLTQAIFVLSIIGISCAPPNSNKSESALPPFAPTPSQASSASPTPPVINYQAQMNIALFRAVNEIVATDEGEIEDPENVQMVRRLLDQGADVNARDSGETPLIKATRNGHIQVMRILLDKGAQIDAQDNNGRTALMIAAQYKDVEMVRLLLSRRPNVNLRDRWGYTALSGSEIIGGSREPAYVAIRRMLIRAGAR